MYEPSPTQNQFNYFDKQSTSALNSTRTSRVSELKNLKSQKKRTYRWRKREISSG